MHKRPRHIIVNLLIALVLYILSPATAAYAQNDATTLPVMHSEIIRSDARITFEWPQPVHFAVSMKGKTITLVFDRKANPDFGALLSDLYPYVTSARRNSDGKTIVLTLDKAYKIRSFASDNVGGIELLGIDPSKGRLASKQAEALSKLTPSAGGDNPDEAVKVNVSATDDAATIRLHFTKRTAVAVYARNDNLWIVLNEATKLDISDFDSLPKTVIGKGEILPGKEGDKNTILRIPFTDNTVRPFVAKEENSFEWAIILSQSPKSLAHPLKINVNTDPPAPPHVFIASLEMGEPVTFVDPVVGDELVVVPLFNLGEAIAVERSFVEFTVLESTQGIVVAKKADDVTVMPLRNGLRISLPLGATLTSGLPEVSSNSELLQNTATMFSYDNWKMDNSQSRIKQVDELFYKTAESIEVNDPQNANAHRLRLAQLYLSEGLAAEALGLLDGINRTNPIFYKSAKLAALHGAANFLMLRYPEAAHDFASSELNHNKEMEYWRSMLADLNGTPAKYDFMEINDDYISKYPPLFRQRLAIVAANHAIDGKEYNSALKIFETLHAAKDATKDAPKESNKDAPNSGTKTEAAHDDILGQIIPYVNFLLAKISVETGQVDEGLASWDKLAGDTSHPYVKAYAEFSRVVWKLNHDGMTRPQAIDRLERLRLVWHGDSLELKILTLLGEIYFEQKDYVNAMRIWDDGITGFPDSASAQDMARRMEETFILLFSEGSIDSLTNMQALTLYYQYKNYAPSGDVGREMVSKLADRLVSVDLLDQAASLLEHQMHFEAEKIKRSQIGAKVATIHLLNHQPQKALAALQDSVYGENPMPLRQLRNRLSAQAFFDLGKYDNAWSVLGQDTSADSDLIRLNIYWQRKDWKQVIMLVEGIMKARKDIAAPITVQESEYLLKLGLAYIFENNSVQLEYLHDYFEPLMADNPNKPLFDFITEKDIAPTPKNFDDVLKNVSNTRSFIDNYKARIKLSGLDAIVPPLTAK